MAKSNLGLCFVINRISLFVLVFFSLKVVLFLNVVYFNP